MKVSLLFRLDAVCSICQQVCLDQMKPTVRASILKPLMIHRVSRSLFVSTAGEKDLYICFSVLPYKELALS